MSEPLSKPVFADIERALREEGVNAVVWTKTAVVKLEQTPIFPSQLKRAFQRAGVAVGDEHWHYEVRLLAMQPSVYALGAKDGHEHVWANNTDVVPAVSAYLSEVAGVQEVIKSAVVVYYE
jgi:hypothetical protein